MHGQPSQTMIITSFTGPHAFLSNFYRSPVEALGVAGPTAEHVFHACKTLSPRQQAWVLGAATPAMAKRRGRQVDLRPGWDEDRRVVMLEITLAKYRQNPPLLSLLAATAPARLVESNDWGDTYWGRVNGEGHNWLGRILEITRDILTTQ